MGAIEVGSDELSPRRARVAVRALLAAAGWHGDRIFEAEVVVSEVVANAVTHGGRLLRLEAALEAGCLRIAVVDASPQAPRRRFAPLDPSGGRGLLLVEAMTDAWGWEPVVDGPARKRVWCELRPRPRSGAGVTFAT